MSDTEVRFISVERMNLYHEVNNTIVSAVTDTSVTRTEIAAKSLSFTVFIWFCYSIKFCIQLCNHQNTNNISLTAETFSKPQHIFNLRLIL